MIDVVADAREAYLQIPHPKNITLTQDGVGVRVENCHRRAVTRQDMQDLARIYGVYREGTTWMMHREDLKGRAPAREGIITDENEDDWQIDSLTIHIDGSVFRCLCTKVG